MDNLSLQIHVFKTRIKNHIAKHFQCTFGNTKGKITLFVYCFLIYVKAMNKYTLWE